MVRVKSRMRDKPYQANQTVSVLSKMFKLAAASGAGARGPSSTATLPLRIVTVTVRPVGISQSRSVQMRQVMGSSVTGSWPPPSG